MAIVNDLETRKANTQRVNSELRRFGLAGFARTFPSWDSYPRAYEVIGIDSIDMDNNPKFALVRLITLAPPNGEVRIFTVKANKNSLNGTGVVVIARINNKYILVRQDRMPVAKRKLELPRCFSGALDGLLEIRSQSLLQLHGLPLLCSANEIGAEVIRASYLKSQPKLVGVFDEDTGYSMVEPSIWYFNIHCDKQVLADRRTEANEMGLEIRLLTLREMVEAFLSHEINDAHSRTALDTFFIEANLLPALINPSGADSLQINWRN